MRALSVKQPFAELIASGKKKVEYRSWKRDFRGPLLIVASASRQDDACKRAGLDPDRLAYGAAVCVVDLSHVTGTEGAYSWHLRTPQRVVPFRVRGYASIYNIEDSHIQYLDGPAARLDRAPSEAKKSQKSTNPVEPRPSKTRDAASTGGKTSLVSTTAPNDSGDPLARWRPALEKSGLVTKRPRPRLRSSTGSR